MGQRAEGYEIHTGFGVGNHGVESDASARFRLSSAGHYPDGLGGVLGQI